jgi:NitT/TauT family transport system permease protein
MIFAILTSRTVAPAVVLAIVLFLWQMVHMLFNVPSYILPSPAEVAEALYQFRGPIALHAAATLTTMLLGFIIGITFGAILGIVIGSSRVFYNAFFPLMIAFNTVPKVAIVPILVVWFGTGAVPAVITATLSSFVPIVINLATGLATIEPEMRDVLRAVGARPRDIIFKVGLPHSAPYFFAALKVSIALAFVGTVISETIASDWGIGYLMISASSRLQVQLVFAGLFVVAVMGISFYAIFATVETYCTSWTTRTQEATFAGGG